MPGVPPVAPPVPRAHSPAPRAFADRRIRICRAAAFNAEGRPPCAWRTVLPRFVYMFTSGASAVLRVLRWAKGSNRIWSSWQVLLPAVRPGRFRPGGVIGPAFIEASNGFMYILHAGGLPVKTLEGGFPDSKAPGAGKCGKKGSRDRISRIFGRFNPPAS